MCNLETAGTDSSHTERPVTENPKVAERKLGLSTSSPSDWRPGALFAYCVLQQISITSEGDQLLQREWVSIKHLTSTPTPHLDWDAPGPTDWMCHILLFPMMSNRTYNLSICLIHFWHNVGKNKIQTGLGRQHHIYQEHPRRLTPEVFLPPSCVPRAGEKPDDGFLRHFLHNSTQPALGKNTPYTHTGSLTGNKPAVSDAVRFLPRPPSGSPQPRWWRGEKGRAAPLWVFNYIHKCAWDLPNQQNECL